MDEEIDPEDHVVDDVAYEDLEPEVPDVEIFGTESVPPDEHEGTEGTE
jgi:hypothetical protein